MSSNLEVRPIDKNAFTNKIEILFEMLTKLRILYYKLEINSWTSKTGAKNKALSKPKWDAAWTCDLN